MLIVVKQLEKIVNQKIGMNPVVLKLMKIMIQMKLNQNLNKLKINQTKENKKLRRQK